MARLEDLPCGCGACLERVQPGHFACSSVMHELIVLRDAGIIDNQYSDGAWRWVLINQEWKMQDIDGVQKWVSVDRAAWKINCYNGDLRIQIGRGKFLRRHGGQWWATDHDIGHEGMYDDFETALHLLMQRA